eukprot:9296707-Pyramimonas_sp.AAC.2
MRDASVANTAWMSRDAWLHKCNAPRGVNMAKCGCRGTRGAMPLTPRLVSLVQANLSGGVDKKSNGALDPLLTPS